jgi:hypothetical protein
VGSASTQHSHLDAGRHEFRLDFARAESSSGTSRARIEHGKGLAPVLVAMKASTEQVPKENHLRSDRCHAFNGLRVEKQDDRRNRRQEELGHDPVVPKQPPCRAH